MRTALAIVNPAAGGGAAARRWRLIRRELQTYFPDLEEAFTEGPGHAPELAFRARTDLVIAAGGDGTVSEVAAGLLRREAGTAAPALGVVPVGRGNDFRRSLAPNPGAESLGARLARGRPRRIDAGRITFRGTKRPPEYFVNVAGAGFEPEVLRIADALFADLAPAAGYLAATLTTLLFHPNAEVELDLDGCRIGVRANSVLVANGRCFAGGMKIAPHADPSDGWLDVIVIGDIGRLRLILTYPRLYLGRHVSSPHVRVFRARRVEVSSGTRLSVEADGDLRGRLPATFEVLPGALEVIA